MRVCGAPLMLVVVLVGRVSAQSIVPAESLKGQLGALSARSSAAAGVGHPELAGQAAALAQLTGLEVSTAPVGTSTGAFSFVLDRTAGTFIRTSQSFGPAFARRSLTHGAGKFTAGFTWLHAQYDSLGDLNLSNGDLVAVRTSGTPLLPASGPLRLDLESSTVAGFASFGVTNDFDIGIMVPWVQVTMGADLTYLTNDRVDITPGGHLLLVPRTTRSGVGDIAVSGKYHFWHHQEGGLAVEVQLRWPTGDVNNLRGTGVARSSFIAIWSRGGKISPHVNAGYEFWSAAVPISATGDVFAKNQVNYAMGVELNPHPRATVAIDVAGRRQLNGGRLGYRSFPLGPGASLELLLPLSKALDVISLAPGVRWNVAGNVLVSGTCLMALWNSGLRANIIPVVSVEWAL